MNKEIIQTILLINLLLPYLAYAEASLWRVSKGNNQIYIGGTVHLLGKSDYPLPDEFEQAFREIDLLVLEADLDALSKPKAQAQIVRSLMYPNDTTLKDQIKPKTFKALERYCKANNLTITAMQKMKPAMVVLTLTMAELKRLGLADAGVDQFFLEKAKSKGKKITGLETAEAQINMLENMGKGHENELILSTIKELKKTPEFMDEMKKAWRTGNLADLEKVGIKTMRAEFPELNKSLLTNRNNTWLPKIKAMLATPERELILVGALHLAGEQGVLAQLKKHGFVVEQY
ncbi:TraB/GumN family protein [Methyloglobulus sp.]|uniref:TraB/GumN family protein n=1 Tax=Methyloglobulus sp. TaxID=2518622 RepID=UPI0032B7E8D5